MNEFKTLLVEDQGAVRIITLNRPEMFNPLDMTSGPELVAALEEAGRDAAVRSLVLTGNGKAFAAGANLRAVAGAVSAGESTKPLFSETAAILNRSVITLRRLPKPVVCALNGVAAGGGLGWALSCDMVVAADTARFDPGYIRIALNPDGGSTALITRIIGLKRASQFFMLSRVISAREALEWGMVNEVVEPKELMAKALELAGRLAEAPAEALASTKALLNQAVLGDLETILENERAEVVRLADRPDFLEGIKAFFEKRKPNFGG